MSVSPFDDDPSHVPTDEEWDNIVGIFRNMGAAVDAVHTPSRPAVQPELPDDDAIADFQSVSNDLFDATSDEEKVAALRSITRWLSQWKF